MVIKTRKSNCFYTKQVLQYKQRRNLSGFQSNSYTVSIVKLSLFISAKLKKEGYKLKKIVFVVGSLRKKSFNGVLAGIAESALKGKADVTYIRPDEVPFLNQDIEFPPPEAVVKVRNIVQEADAVWIFSPEYNYNIPGAEKNLLDWLSRPLIADDPERMTAVVGKKVTICGVGGKNMTATVRARLVDMLEFMRMELVGGMGNGFALPPSAFATGAWEPEQEVVEAIYKQAEELLRALG